MDNKLVSFFAKFVMPADQFDAFLAHLSEIKAFYDVGAHLPAEQDEIDTYVECFESADGDALDYATEEYEDDSEVEL